MKKETKYKFLCIFGLFCALSIMAFSNQIEVFYYIAPICLSYGIFFGIIGTRRNWFKRLDDVIILKKYKNVNIDKIMNEV